MQARRTRFQTGHQKKWSTKFPSLLLFSLRSNSAMGTGLFRPSVACFENGSGLIWPRD